jgi:multidrug efflux pump subunit AcrA (membrane-fusion protein)
MDAIPSQRETYRDPVGDEALRQIDQWVEQVARVSPSDMSEPEFYALLLDRAVAAGSAIGGFVWAVDDSTGFRILAEKRLTATASFPDPETCQQHDRFLSSVCGLDQARWIVTPSSDGQRWLAGVDGRLFACAVRNDQRVVRVVEILQRNELSADGCRGYAALLETLSEVASGFHQKLQLQELRSRHEFSKQTEDFVARIHEVLDTETVVCRIANEGKRLTGCDRLAVLVRSRGSFRVAAVSGLDRPEPRANTVQHLQELAGLVAAMGEPLWYGGATGDLQPSLESAVCSYLDLSHARSLTVIPLSGPDEPTSHARPAAIGALVFETFDARLLDDAYRQRVSIVARHSLSALTNAEQYSRLPLVGWLAAIRGWTERGRHRWLAAAAVLLIAGIAAACWIPADLDVVCQGKSQPAQRRQVFAPVDGQVVQIAVQHGEQVAADQTLVQLESSELAFETTRILGELQTVEKQLSSLQSARLGSSPTTAAQRDEASRLAADEQRLKTVAQSLTQQRELLEQQRQRLQVNAPIAGQVLTWQVTERLQARPVQRGQVLMTIGDTGGPWILELRVPDKDVQIVRAAQDELGPELDVTYILASSPATRHRARLDNLSMLIEPDADQQLSALATVKIASENLPELRPGAGVTARIHCGRRAVGYVWLRDLIATVRQWLFV